MNVVTASSLFLEKEKILEIFQLVYITQVIDEKTALLGKQNKGGTFHLSSRGHELIGVCAGYLMRGDSYWGLPYYRDRGYVLGKGCKPSELIASFLARDIQNHSSGRQMPDHFSDKKCKIPCQSSVVGSQLLQAVGIGEGIRNRGVNEVVYVSIGDGGTSQGDFHEALNFASLHSLPVIFVVQDNNWAISVPKKEQTAGGSIAKIARGYEGLRVSEIDGCDFSSVIKSFKEAITRAKSGPSLIVANVPRIGPHSSSDDPKKYKEDLDFTADTNRDPVKQFENWILENHLMEQSQLDLLKEEIIDEVSAAILLAEESDFEREVSENDCFKPHLEKAYILSGQGDEVVMSTAINHALIEEMQSDEGVIVFGQDVAREKGGVFGLTQTLTEKFGENRCFNTPLAESTIMGLVLGLSLDGFHKPIAEIQFADYIWTGINQLFNEISSYYFRSKGEWNLPLVIRMPCGGYIQGGPYHSQCIEAFLAHVPGLKVVFPSNAEDAKRVLKAAIHDPNPVVFLEHKALYRQRVFAARKEPAQNEIFPIGKAKVIKEGDALTIVSWGMPLVMAYEIAKELDISIEIVDLVTIAPVDIETILASVKKTGKVLVLHEAPKRCGFGAEIAAIISEKAFEYLDAPIMRIGGKNVPVPYSKELENCVLPQKQEIREAILALATF